MTDSQAFLERITQLSPKRLALLALDLQSKLDALSATRTEPIAIVGMGCRLPGGATDPDSYWRLLRDGVDAIREVPADRWDAAALFDADADAPGKIATRWGGFLDDIDQFDPRFFGISPREAASMDPQQRLLLEVGWEALEHAGYAPDGLAETPTGVFVGVCNGDYYQMLMDGDTSAIDAYVATGSAHSVASGRLSYLLGLRGPSLSVDTACSSSLVAVHLAAQSLRNGECRMALAGGVNVVLTPRTTMALSRARMMASDGRCKAFDEAADGFVRSEGCGIVVLKRLSDARADGDRVLALIRGSATNQDGRSNGLTAPNGPSQMAVIREALANAGVRPAEVGYVETHGTGTALGDPIEAQALGAALGTDRPAARPLLIGSAKTNLGHLESAAGVAGLIKAVLTLQHAEIPRLLHFREPSRHIPWSELPLKVPTETTPWRSDDGVPRIAGVSSFGFSGTNAHVILEEAPAASVAPPAETGRTHHLLTLSAGGEASLRELAARYISRLDDQPTLELGDVARAASIGRAPLAHRLAVVATDTHGARAALSDWLAARDVAGLCAASLDAAATPEVAFLFPGQGAQYVGMGKLLYDTEPTFRDALDACAELLRPYLDRPLLAVLWPASHGQPSDVGLLDRTRYTQPATFAIEYALAQLWLSWGIRPAALLGHSVGEYAAACVAGVFSLADALKLVAARGHLMDGLPADGAMASVRAREAFVQRVLGGHPEVSLAALNGPDSVVISGAAHAVEAVLSELALDGVETRRLAISVAAHSPRMDPILDAFERVAREITYASPGFDVVSGMTGQLVSDGALCDPTYWRRHVREAVRFADGVGSLAQRGCRVLLEVGPTPTLLNMAQQCLPDGELTLVPSLRRGTDDWQQLLEGLGQLWARGVDVDWRTVTPDAGRPPVNLPTSPFERTRCWAPRPFRAQARAADQRRLLGTPLESPAMPAGTRVFESIVHAEQPAFIQDHRIHGLLVLPSPVYVEMALSAAAERWGAGAHALQGFSVDEALIVPEHGERTVHLVLADEESGDQAASFKVYSRPSDGAQSDWRLHAAGRLLNAAALPAALSAPRLDTVQAACSEAIDAPAYYARLRELGLEFGPKFQGAVRIWRDGAHSALGQIDLPAPLTAEAPAFHLHPALLDACFHVLGAPVADRDAADASFLLVGIDRLRLYAVPTPRLWDHVMLRQAGAATASSFVADIVLYDAMGTPIAEIGGIHLRRVDQAALLRVTHQSRSDWVYGVDWRQAAPHQKRRDAVAAPSAIVAAIEPRIAEAVERHALSVYADLLPELERLSGAYVAAALVALGWQPREGDYTSAGQLADDLGVLGQHRRLFGRLLEILSEDGYLTPSGTTWRVVRAPCAAADNAAWADRLSAQYPAGSAEVRLAARCGERLADVLRGVTDPLELLFPNGSLELTEPVYVDSPFARVYNTLTAEAAEALAASTPDRPLRILEIGGGTGATTRAILAALEARGLGYSYTFTDVSPLFVARGKDRFGTDPQVTCRALDIEADPVAQGLSAHAYDLVVAANVLHATRDVRRAVEHARTLLAPGGALLLVEGTRQQRWVDLTFGLTGGWWRFEDIDLRPASPLLSAADWTGLLSQLGFEQPRATIAGDARHADLAHQALIVARAPLETTRGDWVVLTDQGGTGAALLDRLADRGERAYSITRAEISGPDDLQRRLARLPSPTGGPRRVVFLWPLDAPSNAADELDRASDDLASSATSVLRASASQSTPTRVWFATRGAQVAAPGESDPSLAQAPLWGLGRVMSLEHPERWAAAVDLDATDSPQAAAQALLDEIDADAADSEDQVALRAGQRLVPRLVRRDDWRPHAATVSANGTHLITGGLGGLGLKLAHWLVERGARHVTLLGRTGLPPRGAWPGLPIDSRAHAQTRAIEALEALGASVEVVAGDVADELALTRLFGRFGADLPALRGVVHAAASLGDMALQDLSDDLLRDSLRPKVRGTWLLHQFTRSLSLDYFVLFSSTTALWGSSGLGHYAAANAFLDSLAHVRRSLGLPAVSVNWGTWDEMRVASAADRGRVAQFGLQPMPAAQALDVLAGLLGAAAPPQVAVASVDWPVLKAAYGARRERPFFSEVGESSCARPAVEAATPELLERVGNAAASERAEIVLAYVKGQAARVLGIEAGRVLDPAQGLFNLGMDSLMSVELKGRLEKATGHPLPSTLTFNYPSINALAGFLLDEVFGEAEPPTADAAPDDALDDTSEDDLAELLAARLAALR